ncbi:MAG: TlpA family protein disulfide reductase [Rhodocyclales bacterium]|nr:TlpA family protein disulfide reductase [Rhodocyclales bacterium]
MKLLCPALVFALFATSTVADESAAPLFGSTLNNLDDKPVALAQYKGKSLVVNFWARWCGPCRAEIPELIKFRNAQHGKVEVLGIGIEDKADAAKEFAKAYDMDYPLFVAKEQGIPLMQALGNSKAGLPFTLFIDAKGQIVLKKLGLLKPADLEAGNALLQKK